MSASRKATPIRSMLVRDSSLRPSVCDGIDAMERSHRKYLAADIRPGFEDSLDLDEAMRPAHPNDNRWDYLLGHAETGAVLALEPHSAKDDQIKTVIGKKRAAQAQLRGHLKDGKTVKSWLWVASGKVKFARTEKARLSLNQAGIQFANKQVLAKHLEDLEG